MVTVRLAACLSPRTSVGDPFEQPAQDQWPAKGTREFECEPSDDSQGTEPNSSWQAEIEGIDEPILPLVEQIVSARELQGSHFGPLLKAGEQPLAKGGFRESLLLYHSLASACDL